MTNDENMTMPEGWRAGVLRMIFFFILVSSSVIPARAQDSEPVKPKAGIQLEFIPPPMEGGTISLGIYDAGGKLVRVLHEEAQPTDFFAALNGLITYWDGKDDAGKLMPAGKYRARGYMAGIMDFEGVAFLGNDWIKDDDSLRIRRIGTMFMDAGKLVLVAETIDRKPVVIRCDASGTIESELSLADAVHEKISGKQPGAAIATGADFESMVTESMVTLKLAPGAENPKVSGTDGRVTINDGNTRRLVELPPGEVATTACPARGGGAWVIVRSGTASEVREYSFDGVFQRRLGIQPGDPQPVKIAASRADDTVFLLEANEKLERVRALTLLASAAATGSASPAPSPASSPSPDAPKSSTWKVGFSKTIRFSDTIDQVRDLLKTPSGKPFTPQEKIKLTLLPNPLEQDRPGAVEISVGVDAKGSFLKAGDGLPLCRVSDTANLRWAAMSGEPGSKVITIFQGDGAVVEQFKAARLANMMSFDCGDFDFDPAKMK